MRHVGTCSCVYQWYVRHVCIFFSGKSTLVANIIDKHTDYLAFEPSRVLWLSHYQPQTLFQGRLELERLTKVLEPPKDGRSIVELLDDQLRDQEGDSCIVIDDLAPEVESDFRNVSLAARLAHHRRCLLFYISQAIFGGGRTNRYLQCNATYYVLLRSARNNQALRTLGGQLFNDYGCLQAISESLTNFEALLIDLDAKTPPCLGLRTLTSNPTDTKVFLRP